MSDERVGTGLFNAPATSLIQKDPLGVVLILGAWNYNVLLSLQVGQQGKGWSWRGEGGQGGWTRSRH
jgi:hypothetical protein